MITSEFKGSDDEVKKAYYDIYMYNLEQGLMNLRRMWLGFGNTRRRRAVSCLCWSL